MLIFNPKAKNPHKKVEQNLEKKKTLGNTCLFFQNE
jgi:hypothetical protein